MELTLIVLLSAATVCQLLTVALCNVDAGMRVTVSEKTLQEINRVEIAEIESKLRVESFPDKSDSSGDFDWKLSNIRVSNLDSLTASLDLLDGNLVTWTGSVSDITVKMDYWVRYKKKILGIRVSVSDDGHITARLRRTSLSITLRLSVTNGRLTIALDQCSGHIGDLDPDIGGSLLAWIANTLKGIITGDLKRKLEDVMCDVVRDALEDLSNDMTSLETLNDVKIIGLPIVVDTSFAEITVTHDNICVYNKAEFIWNGQVYSPADSGVDFLPKSDLGIGFDLKTDATNNLLKALAAGGRLDGDLAYQELKDRGLHFFDLQCEHICIGKAFRKTSSQYPNSVLGMRWAVQYGGVEVHTDELLGRLVGRVFFDAENGTNSVHLFSASLNLTAHFQARFAANALSVRAVGLGGLILIDESLIGKVLSPNVQFLLENIILKVLRAELLKIINDYDTDYILPLPARTSFKDSSIKFYPGVIRVEADICYKTACDFSGSGEWVGKDTTDNFDVQDILPTTPTTTTTTTMTTTTTTTTPPPTPPTRDQSSGKGKQTSSGQAGQEKPSFKLLFVTGVYVLLKLLKEYYM